LNEFKSQSDSVHFGIFFAQLHRSANRKADEKIVIGITIPAIKIRVGGTEVTRPDPQQQFCIGREIEIGRSTERVSVRQSFETALSKPI
jgi:hypothetical protein